MLCSAKREGQGPVIRLCHDSVLSELVSVMNYWKCFAAVYMATLLLPIYSDFHARWVILAGVYAQCDRVECGLLSVCHAAISTALSCIAAAWLVTSGRLNRQGHVSWVEIVAAAVVVSVIVGGVAALQLSYWAYANVVVMIIGYVAYRSIDLAIRIPEAEKSHTRRDE